MLRLPSRGLLLSILAAVPFAGGCAHESLSLNIAANPTTQAAESNAPLIGEVNKGKQHFAFIIKGRTVKENGQTHDAPYKAGLQASGVHLVLPELIGALIRGQLGAAGTATVDAYADGTTFAVITEVDGTTYVVHIDHTAGESVTVKLRRNGALTKITANGFVIAHRSDLKLAAFTPITNNDTLDPLPADIAAEVKALRGIAQTANVPAKFP